MIEFYPLLALNRKLYACIAQKNIVHYSMWQDFHETRLTRVNRNPLLCANSRRLSP